MSCCIDFHYWLYYRDDFHPMCMSGNLSDEISWFLSPLSLSQFYKPDLKNNLSQIYYQKEKIFINKVFQKNTISSTGFP